MVCNVDIHLISKDKTSLHPSLPLDPTMSIMNVEYNDNEWRGILDIFYRLQFISWLLSDKARQVLDKWMLYTAI